MSEQTSEEIVISDADGDPSTEAEMSEAYVQGWRPREEFHGDPKEWRTAKAFLERGQRIAAIVNKQLAAERAQTAQLRSQLTEMRATMDEFREFSARSEDRAYKRALADLKAAKREARRSGDDERIDQIEEEIEALERPTPVQRAAPATTPAPQADPAFLAWRAENPWFGTDHGLTGYATGIANDVAAEIPGLIGRPYFDEVTRRVREAFPHKFGARPSPVSGGGTRGAGAGTIAPSGKRGRTYNDLPADARAACDRFVAQKYLTREQYCAQYDWD